MKNRKIKAQYWADKFNISKNSLKKAIKKVGVSSEKIEKFLKKNKALFEW